MSSSSPHAQSQPRSPQSQSQAEAQRHDPPGGAPIAMPTNCHQPTNNHAAAALAKSQTARSPISPAPVAAPVAVSPQRTGQNVKSPQSSSMALASFYGMAGEGGGGSTNVSPAPPSNARTPDSASHASAASAYYAAAASSGNAVVSPKSPNQPSSAPQKQPSSILASIASKFDSSARLNLLDRPSRVLVREGYLQRQATFKNVDRYCYLFDDVFIVTEPVLTKHASAGAMSSDDSVGPFSPRLTMKQIVWLRDATISFCKKDHIFIIDHPGKSLWFECGSSEEAREWKEDVERCIEQAKLHSLPSAASSSASASSSKRTLKKQSRTIWDAIDNMDEQHLLYVLSERGEDPNQVDEDGRTPLHRCADNGFTDGVTLLLAHDARIDVKDNDGKTPLHIAALNDQYALLLFLLASRPNLSDESMLDANGRTALWDLMLGPYRCGDAHSNEHTHQQQQALTSPLSKRGHLKRQWSTNQQQQQTSPSGDRRGSFSGLHHSDSDKSSDSDEYDDDDDDGEADAPSPSQSSQSLRSLHSRRRRAWKNLCECLQVMIETCRIDMEQKDKTGKTLLMHLASIHSYESLELLLSKGASLSSIDDAGRTPLHYAVSPLLSHGSAEESDLGDILRCVRALLQAGMSPNLRDHAGNTPLHLTRSLPIAGCLVVHGARLDVKNEAGMKASCYFEEQANRGADLADALNSLQEARNQFLSRPDTYLHESDDIDANTWLNDDLSDACLLCGGKFSITQRRHHCRRCGLLICGSCSTKKFSIPRKRGEEGLRACDGCYNQMAHQYLKTARVQRRERMRRRQEEEQVARDRAAVIQGFEASHESFLRMQAAEEERIAAKLRRIEEAKAHPDKPRSPPPKSTKRSAASSSSSSSSSASARDRDVKLLSSQASSGHQKAQENRRLALERGERLAQMEDKAQRMEADAENFASLAKKLKEKQKSTWF